MSENEAPSSSGVPYDSFDDDSLDGIGKLPTSKNPESDSTICRKRANNVLQEVNEEDSFLDSPEKFQAKRPNMQKTPMKSHTSPKKRSPKIVISSQSDSGLLNFPCLSDKSSQHLLFVKETEEISGNLILRCTTEAELECCVYLQDQWINTKVDIGSKIRIIGAQKWGETDWLIDDSNGVIIVDPDVLVSSTSIAQGLYCERKAVLNDRFRGGCGTNKAMLMGCIIHQLFQTALSRPASTITSEWVLSEWRHAVMDDIETLVLLVALDFTPRAFENELAPYVEVIVSWIRDRIHLRKPLPSGGIMEEVVDIEENIWLPTLGIKGKVDVTLKTLKNGKFSLEPLELKTGKSSGSADHMAQVMVYCMMFSVLNESPMGTGSLLYLKDGQSKEVKSRAAELKGVLDLRNKFAYHSKSIGKDLPEPLSDPRNCEKCDHMMTCVTYQKTLEKHKPKISEKMNEFANQACAHLDVKHMQYFERWINWMYLEWRAAAQRAHRQSDIWNKSPDEREARGQCLSNMKFERSDGKPNGSFVLHFQRNSLLPESIISRGDIVTVSTSERFALVMGSVVEFAVHSISVRVDRRLPPHPSHVFFHIDKHESFTTFAMNLANVSQFLSADQRTSHLRSLIIDLTVPRAGKMSKDHAEVVKPMVCALNKGQARAVARALMCKDYSLIEGLPGSGKTTTIAVLVRCLVALGHTVLITSYTHSAVDNLLIKLIEHIPASQMLRLGRTSSVKPQVAHLTLEAKIQGTTDDVYKTTKDILKNTPVVACSCLATTSHSLFSWRSFDFCVVDEASLVLESTLLAPLSAADRFVLVGDARQLSPLVQSRQAKEEGMAVSLFERLQVHDTSTVSLTSQYRMNRKIAEIASSLFYDDKLVCANEKVADACLVSEGYRDGIMKSTETTESDSIFSLKLEDSCIWADTQSDKFDKYQMKVVGGAISNMGEAELTREYVMGFIKIGVPAQDIGVMCAYRRQVEVIKGVLGMLDVEVNTVDQYQGRDKSVIIWSLAWTHGRDNKRSDLLSEKRRVNVALTRAKHKLIIVGCAVSMRQIEIMSKVAEKVKVIPAEEK